MNNLEIADYLTSKSIHQIAELIRIFPEKIEFSRKFS
jgi:hypothetical protein